MITSHGGRLWAEHRAEGGAAFYVALPLAREHARLTRVGIGIVDDKLSSIPE
jgi:K+-sensing histidine kinase KdpD